MTKADKPVTRESYSTVRVRQQTRPLIIEVHSTWVSIRPKGMRTAYVVTLDQIYNIGARNAAEALRKERAEARKTKRKSIV